jgi:hypothetical protein
MQNSDYDRFTMLLGELVMHAGALERLVPTSIKILSDPHRALASMLLHPNSKLDTHIDILRRVCHFRLSSHPQALADWMEAIKRLDDFAKERNRIVHDLYSETDDGEVMRTQLTVRGTDKFDMVKDKVIPLADFEQTVASARLLRLQFQDFCLNAPENPPLQNSYPRLAKAPESSAY